MVKTQSPTVNIFEQEVTTKGMDKTVCLYKNNRYIKEYRTAVLNIQNEALILKETIFFPTGGGQSCDKGTINGIDVIDVFEIEGTVFHKVSDISQFKPGQNVFLSLDWEHRFLNMQRHCGEHILSGKFFEVCGGINKGFHMGTDYMTIDIDIPNLPWETCMKAERAANEVIWKNEKVEYHHFLKKSDADGFPLRKPLTIENDITIVSIGDLKNPADSVACCGTHPDYAGEVGIIKIYKTEKNKNMTRIYFDAGRKAYDAYTKKQELLNILNAKYSSGDSTLISKIAISDQKNDKIRSQLHTVKQHLLNELTLLILESRDSFRFSKALNASILIYSIPTESKFEILGSKELANLSKLLSEKISSLTTVSPHSPQLREEQKLVTTDQIKIPSLIMLPIPEENLILIFSDGVFDCGKYVKENSAETGFKGGGNPISARLMFRDTAQLQAYLTTLKKT